MRGYAELGVQHIMFQCEPYGLEALRRLTEQGMTVILVTHEPDVAAYAQRLLRVRDGRIVEDRAVADSPVEHHHVEQRA